MKTAKPAVAGLLTLVAGIVNLLVGSGAWRRAALAERVLVRLALHGFGFFAVVFGILAIIGGILALNRKAWGMGLTGSILSLFPPATILGIPAIILLAMSRDEFKTT